VVYVYAVSKKPIPNRSKPTSVWYRSTHVV
jgi:hypothetical protein